MVTLKRYSNLTEADEDKALLEAAGIPAFLAGENITTAGYGGILNELRLQVAEADLERARHVLGEHEGFAPLPDDFVPPEEPPDDTASEKQSAVSNVVMCLLVLSVLFNIIFLLRYRDRHSYTGTQSYDYNHDGHPDHWYHYQRSKIISSEQDRDFNGFPDVWWHYEDGVVTRCEEDQNFDGKPDIWDSLRYGVTISSDADVDFDSIPDVHSTFVNGVLDESIWYTKAGNAFRHENYRHGVRYEELLDDDGDGWFDKRTTYDSLHRLIGTESIHQPVPAPRNSGG